MYLTALWVYAIYFRLSGLVILADADFLASTQSIICYRRYSYTYWCAYIEQEDIEQSVLQKAKLETISSRINNPIQTCVQPTSPVNWTLRIFALPKLLIC